MPFSKRTVKPTRTNSALAVALMALAAPSVAPAKSPSLVSPGSSTAFAVSEARCPTFSWGGAPGAPGYELVVFRLTDDRSHDPDLVTRIELPADSRAWTPSVGQCLARGSRYAWSLAVTTQEPQGGEREWAPAFLFEVEAADGVAPERTAPRIAERAGPGPAPVSEWAARDSTVEILEKLEEVLPAGIVREVSEGAATPGLPGTVSLRASHHIHLGGESAVFKDDDIYLWDDDLNGNTALGRRALASVSDSSFNNTAFGLETLQNTTGGDPFHGSYNTAIGTRALKGNTTGRGNTATGFGALAENLDGYSNTATGTQALPNNTTGRNNVATGFLALADNEEGSYNVAVGNWALEKGTGSSNTVVGYGALRNAPTTEGNIALGAHAGSNLTSGSSNIFIGSNGGSTDSSTIRIGSGSHTSTFLAGISGASVPSGVPVLVEGTGKLGTVVSSLRFKQDVTDLGALTERLLDLRPVAFRYKDHVAQDPDAAVQFGLIAEEVAEVLPELVVYDDEGRPQTVKYHLLSTLLLGELQDTRRLVERQAAENVDLETRLAAVEAQLEGAEPSAGRR